MTIILFDNFDRLKNIILDKMEVNETFRRTVN